MFVPQLGLLVDFSPDGLMIPEDGVNDEELEAEFLALVGGQPQALEKLKSKGENGAQDTLDHLWSFRCGRCLELSTGLDVEQENRRPPPSWSLGLG